MSAGAACCASATGSTAASCRQGAIVHASYQIGGGHAGNVGADRLTHVLPLTGPLAGAIVSAWNPFDVIDGREPEPVERIRRHAPEAFRARQLRAVTLADYVEPGRRGAWRVARGRPLRLDGQLAHGAGHHRSDWDDGARGQPAPRRRRAPRGGPPDRRRHRAAASPVRSARDSCRGLRRAGHLAGGPALRAGTGVLPGLDLGRPARLLQSRDVDVRSGAAPQRDRGSRPPRRRRASRRAHRDEAVQPAHAGRAQPGAAGDGIRRGRAARQRSRSSRARFDPFDVTGGRQ